MHQAQPTLERLLGVEGDLGDVRLAGGDRAQERGRTRPPTEPNVPSMAREVLLEDLGVLRVDAIEFMTTYMAPTVPSPPALPSPP